MCAKKNTKTQIIEKSLEIFNENSWSKTSLRKIAASLNISDGNLRYHYKTKEEVVLKLFSMMIEELDEVLFLYKGKKTDDLVPALRTMFTIMFKYRFLFLESILIKQAYPVYRIIFNELQEGRKAYTITEYNRLIAEGILSSEFSTQQYEALFEQLFILSDSWMKYLDSTSDMEYVNARIEHYVNLCFALSVPYLVRKV